MGYNVTCMYGGGSNGLGNSICQAQGVSNGWWFGASLNVGQEGVTYSSMNGVGYATFSSDAYSPYLTSYIDSQAVYAYNMQGAGAYLASQSSYVTWPQWMQDYATASPNFSVLGLYSNQAAGGGTTAETLPAPITETPTYLKPYFPPTSPPADATGPGNWQWNGTDWTWQAVSMPPSNPPPGETFGSGYYYQDPQGNWQWQHVNAPPSQPPSGETWGSGYYYQDAQGNWQWQHQDPPPSSPPDGQTLADGWWQSDGHGGWSWFNWHDGTLTPYVPPGGGSSTGACTIQDMASFGSCVADNGGTIALAVISIAAVLAVVYVARKGAVNVLAMLKPKKG